MGRELRSPTTFCFGVAEVVYELGHVVLQELLALRRQEGDDLLVVHGVRTHQAEIEDPLVEPQRHAAQSVADRAVLLVGERLGIDDMQLEPSAGEPLVLVQQRAHPVGVTPDAGQDCRARAPRDRTAASPVPRALRGSRASLRRG